MPDLYSNEYRDLSAERKAEERKLRVKGLLPGSNKFHSILWRIMRKKYRV